MFNKYGLSFKDITKTTSYVQTNDVQSNAEGPHEGMITKRDDSNPPDSCKTNMIFDLFCMKLISIFILQAT